MCSWNEGKMSGHRREWREQELVFIRENIQHTWDKRGSFARAWTFDKEENVIDRSRDYWYVLSRSFITCDDVEMSYKAVKLKARMFASKEAIK